MEQSQSQTNAIQVYCNCRQSTKNRLKLIDAITAGSLKIDHEAIDAEFARLQLCRTLELLAFASISAHKDWYAAAHADFAKHWNAKRLLERLAKLHPDFYSQPVSLAGIKDQGVKQLAPIKDGFYEG